MAIAGSDAERRAARALSSKLRAAGMRPRTDTFWVRPQWPIPVVLCVIAGIAASVLSVERPVLAAAVAGAAALALVADTTGWVPLLRRLTYERASQNVTARVCAGERAQVTVLLCAPIDAPRRWIGERVAAPLRWVLGALLAVAAFAGARLAGAEGSVVGAAQFVPSVILILAVGAFLDAATAGARPARAGELAVEIALELQRRPPRHLAVELVLHGAGWAHAAGMRRFARGRRFTPEEVVVIEVGEGPQRIWRREGLLLPLSYHPRLVELAAADHASGTTSAARVARGRRWPAIRLQDSGPATCLALVAAIDRDLSENRPR